MPAPDPTPLPKEGTILAGKYLVEKVLGEGGMGVVVAAQHLALRQRVAVKLLQPAAAALPNASARFLREARAMAAIQSEHVARVLDVGADADGTPYMVMEHLVGITLSRLLKQRGPLPVADAVDYVVQAIDAVAEAHALGIVHRDLKPANLFLTTRADGTPLVKVLDFGLSKMSLEHGGGVPEGSLTATDMVMGSPQYMSPEQVRSLKEVDARTDVWAFGVILYELLTGRRPFDADNVLAVCAGIVSDTPQPPRALRPEIPEALEALVLHCLEKKLEDRTPSVAEIAQELLRSADAPTAIAGGAAPEPRPAASAAAASAVPGPITETGAAWADPAPAMRRRSLTLAAGGAAALVGGVIAIVTVGRIGAPAPSPPAVPSASPPIAIHLAVEPLEAIVRIDGVPTRDNPILLPRGDRRHTLVLSAPGYEPESREVDGADDARVSVTLHRSPSPAPETPTAVVEPPKPVRSAPPRPAANADRPPSERPAPPAASAPGRRFMGPMEGNL
jgi:serine/threonine-protein kinase